MKLERIEHYDDMDDTGQAGRVPVAARTIGGVGAEVICKEHLQQGQACRKGGLATRPPLDRAE